jgi:hypothetical protein
VAIVESPDGDASLSFDHPADLFGVFGDSELDVVGEEFTHLWTRLLEHLNLPIPEVSSASAAARADDSE